MQSIKQIGVIALVSILAIGLPNTSAIAEGLLNGSQISSIKLYLPIRSKAFSTTIETLNAELIKNKIDNIDIETIDYWHSFQQGIRSGRIGIYFAPPHFASWVINNYEFKPLLRLSKPLSYVIATHRNNRNLFEVNDLADRIVCSSNPLNLDYLLISKQFANSLYSPKIEIVESVRDQMIRSTNCEAFAVSNHYFDQLAVQFPDKYIRLLQSPVYNNFVLVAHPDISVAQIAQLQTFFLQRKIQDLLGPVFDLFTRSGVLVRANISDYPINYQLVLQPYWQAKKNRAQPRE